MSLSSAEALERNIESARRAAKKPDLRPEHVAWLAQMMTIWASAYLELTFRARMLEYCRRHSDGATRHYVMNSVARVRNPSVESICGVLGQFDADWKKTFRVIAGNSLSTSVDSIVDQRNRIAHGEITNVTVDRIYRHFEVVRAFGDVLTAVLETTERRPVRPGSHR